MKRVAVGKAWAFAAVAAALALAMVGLAGCASDGSDDTADEGSAAVSATSDDADDEGSDADADETTMGETLKLAFSDANDETQNVIEHILADDASSVLQSYTTAFLEGRSTLSTIALVLPLGSYLESAAEDGTGAAVEIAYVDLSAVDADAVDCALAYDVMALFCCTSLNNITVTISGGDTYAFSRETVESVLNLYGVTDASLTSDLFKTQEDWETVRDALFQDNTYEVVLDVATE